MFIMSKIKTELKINAIKKLCSKMIKSKPKFKIVFEVKLDHIKE